MGLECVVGMVGLVVVRLILFVQVLRIGGLRGGVSGGGGDLDFECAAAVITAGIETGHGDDGGAKTAWDEDVDGDKL